MEGAQSCRILARTGYKNLKRDVNHIDFGNDTLLNNYDSICLHSPSKANNCMLSVKNINISKSTASLNDRNKFAISKASSEVNENSVSNTSLSDYATSYLSFKGKSENFDSKSFSCHNEDGFLFPHNVPDGNRNEVEPNNQDGYTSLSDYAASYLRSKGKTENLVKPFPSQHFNTNSTTLSGKGNDVQFDNSEITDIKAEDNYNDKKVVSSDKHKIRGHNNLIDVPSNSSVKNYVFLRPPTMFRVNSELSSVINYRAKSIKQNDTSVNPLCEIDDNCKNCVESTRQNDDDLLNKDEINFQMSNSSYSESKVCKEIENLNINNNSDSGLGTDDDNSVKSTSSQDSISDHYISDQIDHFKCDDNYNEIAANICTLDIIDIEEKSSLEVDISPLSIVLCRKWTPPRIPIVKRNYYQNSQIKHFQFDTPSPDDLFKIRC